MVKTGHLSEVKITKLAMSCHDGRNQTQKYLTGIEIKNFMILEDQWPLEHGLIMT